MHEPDFWSQCAEAMELSIEGRRLIALEVADMARRLWHGATRGLDNLLHRRDERPHLPPT